MSLKSMPLPLPLGLSTLLADRPLLLVTLLVLGTLCTLLATSHFLPRDPLSGSWNTHDLRQVVRSHFVKDHNQIYRVGFPHRVINVLPLQFLKDYGWEPEKKVSSSIDLHERLHGEYLEFASLTPEEPGDSMGMAIAYAKGPMTKSQDRVLPVVHEEVAYCLTTDMGKCPDWTPFGVHDLAMKLPLRIYERIFVGQETSRDATWMQCLAIHSAAVGAAAGALSRYSDWTRPFVANFLPELTRLRKARKDLIDVLAPLHKTALARRDSASSKESLGTFVDFFVDNAGPRAEDTRMLARALVGVSFAGIQSSGTVLVNVLFDLLSRPEYMDPLRAELDSVIAVEGTPELSSSGLNKLVRMDSFIKESQRHTHGNLLSVYRKIRQPLRLSNGTQLPANSYVAVPGSAYAKITPDGSETPFEGFRWAEKRARNEGEYGLSYASTSSESLEFGYGSHACPGRFIASNVLKVCLSHLLLKYEMRFLSGQERPVADYTNIMMLKPSVDVRVEVRDRA